jgi:hypothetical protein
MHYNKLLSILVTLQVDMVQVMISGKYFVDFGGIG